MSTPREHLKFQFNEIDSLNDQLNLMRHWGVLKSDPGFQRLTAARNAAWGKIGLNLPRTTTLIRLLTSLSPGEIKLWADAEIGWITESRVEPGAPPVRKLVTDEVAEKLLTGKLTHELEESLMAPDPYIGE